MTRVSGKAVRDYFFEPVEGEMEFGNVGARKRGKKGGDTQTSSVMLKGTIQKIIVGF